jgi:hypothetical protein
VAHPKDPRLGIVQGGLHQLNAARVVAGVAGHQQVARQKPICRRIRIAAAHVVKEALSVLDARRFIERKIGPSVGDGAVNLHHCVA